ncbi:DUF6042 family protein [Paenibacillus sp. TAB 01]|uniref:DUF6042 family protein n=1 Tax=Paenibacillus sp. TAB 01 TaxID=3368988 RepID=UPI003750B70D
MFSFQNEVINFMTNGRVTVRTLDYLGLISAGQCAIPNQFYELGWGRWLPMPNITSLPYISNSIASSLNKEGLVKHLEQKVKSNTFIDFSIRVPQNLSQSEKDEYELLYVRETEIKRRLEANGYQYPSNMQEVVNLYIDLGVAYELQDDHYNGLLDLIIRPLPHIDTVLLLK